MKIKKNSLSLKAFKKILIFEIKNYNLKKKLKKIQFNFNQVL